MSDKTKSRLTTATIILILLATIAISTFVLKQPRVASAENSNWELVNTIDTPGIQLSSHNDYDYIYIKEMGDGSATHAFLSTADKHLGVTRYARIYPEQVAIIRDADEGDTPYAEVYTCSVGWLTACTTPDGRILQTHERARVEIHVPADYDL